MTWLDILILVFTALMALAGYRRGAFASALSLVGFAAGAIAGGHLAPLVLARGAQSPYAPVLALAGALLLGLLASGLLERLGLELHARLGPATSVLDGAAGAVLLAVVALGVVWLLGTAVVHAAGPGAVRRDVRQSQIFRDLTGALPPSSPVLGVLARLDPLPQIAGPQANVAPPPPAIAGDRSVAGAASRVVRVTGTACGAGIEGSGWIAGDGEVVTAAHVVAGETDTSVQPGGTGPAYPARAIAFDPHDDVAVLSVPALRGVPPLPLAPGAPTGTAAAILGFPQDGPYNVQPGRVGTTSTVLAQDAYGDGPVSRQVTSFRGVVRPGNSGGPLVDANGRVVGTVFARTTGSPRSGLAVPDGIVAGLLSRAAGPVATGHCVS